MGELETFFDELFEGGRARHIDTAWLDGYRDIWKQQRATRLKLDRIQKKTTAIRTYRTESTTIPTRIREHAVAFTGGIAGWPRELKLVPDDQAIRWDGG